MNKRTFKKTIIYSIAISSLLNVFLLAIFKKLREILPPEVIGSDKLIGYSQFYGYPLYYDTIYFFIIIFSPVLIFIIILLTYKNK